MGAELDRLMKLYGVGSATIAPYGGISKPADTTAADYQSKLDQYNVEKPAYDKYVTDYKNRIASTPMYAQQQYRAALAPDTYEKYVKSVSPTPEVYTGPKDGSFFNPDMIVAPPTLTVVDPNVVTPPVDTTKTTGPLTTLVPPEYKPDTTKTTTVDPEKKVEEVVTTPEQTYTYDAPCCFDPDAPILMADGAWKRIADVVKGDRVTGLKGEINTVVDVKTTTVGSRKMMRFDGHNFYSTDDHLFLTNKGWKTWVPSRLVDNDRENAEFLEGENRVIPLNDYDKMIVLVNGEFTEENYNHDFVQTHDFPADYVVYDLHLDGDQTYIVDGFVVHNCGSDSGGGGGWAVGGLIRKYGIGGQVKNYGRGGVSDLADKYDVSEPANPTDLPVVLASNTAAPTMNDAGMNPPAAVPQAPSMGGYTFGNVGGAGITAAVPAAPAAPAASPSQRFEDLVSKYAGTGDKYKEDIKAASAKAKAETEAFQKRIADAMKGNEDTMPSKAEMYFRLAAALGAPTKTKSGFMENVAGAAGAMADYQKSVTEAKRANQAQNLQLGLKGQELSMQAAKEELAMLQGLDTQEAQDRRAILKAQIEHEMKAMEPDSAEGKRARDEGFIPGTEAFKERVKQLVSQSPTMREDALRIQQQKLEETIKQNEEKNKTLPPKIVELKSEAEKRIDAADAMESKFARAWDLSDPEKDQVFSGSTADKAQRKFLELTNSKHPKVVNTDELEQLLGQNAVDQLKAAFGGNPSNKEGEIIRDLQGIGAKSLEGRRVIIENTVNALRERREKEKERLKHINAGDYNKAQQGEK
jgi:hypothetical protein